MSNWFSKSPKTMNPGFRGRAFERVRPQLLPGEVSIAVVGQATVANMPGLRNLYSGAQAMVLTNRRLFIVANPIEEFARGTFRLAAGRFRNTAHVTIDAADGRRRDLWVQRAEFDQLRLMETSLGVPPTF